VGDVDIDVIEPNEEEGEEPYRHKIQGKLTTSVLGYQSPWIEGKFVNAKETNKGFSIMLEFEDLAPYRMYGSGEKETGSVIYLNPRYMLEWMFGFVFNEQDQSLGILNGLPMMIQQTGSSVKLEENIYHEYYQGVISYLNKDIDRPSLFIVKKLTRMYNAFQLVGTNYCLRQDCPSGLREIEMYSADPNHARWESNKFELMTAFYQVTHIKADVYNFDETEENERLDFQKYGRKLIQVVHREKKLIGKFAFLRLLSKMDDVDELRLVVNRIGGFVVGVEEKDIMELEINPEAKQYLLGELP
jgi:hypothetical protein